MSVSNKTTPGVYTVEKNSFPPAVGEVATAIPAFIGYTAKAEKDGKSLHMTPQYITSLDEYDTYFGGEPDYTFPVNEVSFTTLPAPADQYDLYIAGKYYKVMAATKGNLYLYNSLQMFYLNGGGEAYIVSVGTYLQPSVNDKGETVYNDARANKDDLFDGLETLKNIQFPKPTMILIPDGMALDEESDNIFLQQQMLIQAGELMDRVAMLDIYDGYKGLDTDVISNFRNNIGLTSLNYGAAYYPWLECNLVDNTNVNYANIDQTATDAIKMPDLFPGNGYVKQLEKIAPDTVTVEQQIPVPAIKDTTAKTWDQAFNMGSGDATAVLTQQATTLNAMYQVLYDLANTKASTVNTNLTILSDDLQAAIAITVGAKSTLSRTMIKLGTYDSKYPGKALGVIDVTKFGLTADTTTDPYNGTTDPNAAFTIANNFFAKTFDEYNGGLNSVITNAITILNQYDLALENSNADYLNLQKAIARQVNILPPSGAMAGIYTYMDNNFGVWYAPANINIAAVNEPMVNINDDQQGSLNVDALAGKSINAIRSFYGRGPAIVWGARTLDGNSRDWRYVNVRRTMIMIEESIKNAAFSMVFQPNDAVTWKTTEGMISSFLATLWRSGALQGSAPADAYDVSIGLGKTMTAMDILDGYMRVTVRVAIVRPAEFIIITYEQKMATS